MVGFECAVRGVRAAAYDIIAAAAPPGSYGELLVEIACTSTGDLRSQGRWTRLITAAFWDAGGFPLVPQEASVGFECCMAAADLLDEIQDGDPSPIADVYGLPIASNGAAGLLVLGSTFMRRQALSRADGHRSDAHASLAEALADGLLAAASGQHMDLRIGATDTVTERQLDLAAAKSGSLGRAACTVGALCATSDRGRIDQLGDIGSLIGIAAQLRNNGRGLLRKSEDSAIGRSAHGELGVDAIVVSALSREYIERAISAAQVASASWLVRMISERSGATSETHAKSSEVAASTVHAV